MQKIWSSLLCLLSLPLVAWAQVDTTSADYRIGYKIGSWLPFIVLGGLFILMLIMARRRSDEKE